MKMIFKIINKNTRNVAFYAFLSTTTEHKIWFRGADNSLARPTSRYILFDGENISFDAKSCYINK
jgi:homoserine trans-succinylase